MEDQLTLFSQYESEYCNKSTDLSRKIDGISSLVGDQRRRKVSEVEYDVREAEQVIKRMETEARSFAPDHSQNVLAKVRDYKRDLQSLKDQLKGASRTAAPSGESARKDLGLGSEYFSTTSTQRDQMLKATEQANRSTERLRYGRQQLLETEELGADILTDLSRQREQITRTTDILHGAGEKVVTARKILSSMSRRIFTNKIILGAIAFILLLAIILVVYFKFS
eukprot:g3425.t1